MAMIRMIRPRPDRILHPCAGRLPSRGTARARRGSHQGCKIRSGRDRIIRIIAIGIWSEIIKILLAFCRNSSEIEKFDKFSTFSTEFGEIPRNFHQDRCKIRWKLWKIAKFWKKFWKLQKLSDENLLKYWIWSGAKEWYSCRSRKALQNEYLVAKIGFDTAENEPLQVGENLWNLLQNSV